MQSPKTKNQLYPFSLLTFLLICFLLTNCKKIDLSPNLEDPIHEQFFKIPENASVELQKLICELKTSELKGNNLKMIVEQSGYPVWEKAVYSKLSNAVMKSNSDPTDLVFIPLNKNREIKSYFLAIKLDSDYRIKFYSKRYLSSRYSTNRDTALSIKTKLSIIAYFENSINNKQETSFSSPLVKKIRDASIKFVRSSAEKNITGKVFGWQYWQTQICWSEETNSGQGDSPTPPEYSGYVRLSAIRCTTYSGSYWVNDYEEADQYDHEGGGNSGGGGGGGESPLQNGFYPSRIAELKNFLQQNPFGLVPCQYLQQFMNIGSYQAPQTVTNRISQLNQNYINNNEWNTWVQHPFYIQNINNAASEVVNCDYFPVHVKTLPSINGIQLTAEQLFDYFRKNWNMFIDNSIATFSPYNQPNLFNDESLWLSNSPLSAMLQLNMINNGTVIVSDFRSTQNNVRLLVSTMRSPLDINHPVSGNRAWGIFPDTQNSGFVFYTSGVDRINGIAETVANTWMERLGLESGFDKADKLWKSLQDKMITFVNANGGIAEKYNSPAPQIIWRPNWSDLKEYFEKTITLEQLLDRLGC